MVFMTITFDRAKRQEQKEYLGKYYADYSPIHHDVFVLRFNRELQEQADKNYQQNRGIKP
jgi:hypothetical protein